MRKWIAASMLAVTLAGANAWAAEGTVARVNGVDIPLQALERYNEIAMSTKGFKPKPGYAVGVLIQYELVVQEGIRQGMDEKLERPDIVKQVVRKFLSEQSIDEADLRNEYKKRKAAAAGEPEYHLEGLGFSTEDEARLVILKLAQGDPLKKFIEQSVDKNLRKDAGDMGWLSMDNMHPSFQIAVAELNKGNIYKKPIPMAGNYYVIRLLGTRTDKMPSYESIRTDLGHDMLKVKYDAWLKSLEDKATIERMPGYEATKVIDPLNLRKTP